MCVARARGQWLQFSRCCDLSLCLLGRLSGIAERVLPLCLCQAPWNKPGKGGWDEDGNMVIGGTAFKKGGGGDADGSGKIMF